MDEKGNTILAGCSTALFQMVVKKMRSGKKIQLCCSTAYFHMAVKVNMQLTTRFISAGEHNIINIDLKAIVAFF